jgi:hypothetical protein
MSKDINESTAKAHRESVAKAFGAKPSSPAPAPAAKPNMAKEADDLQKLLGKDVVVGKKAGGMVSSASKRADGCAIKGKTRGRMV